MIMVKVGAAGGISGGAAGLGADVTTVGLIGSGRIGSALAKLAAAAGHARGQRRHPGRARRGHPVTQTDGTKDTVCG